MSTILTSFVVGENQPKRLARGEDGINTIFGLGVLNKRGGGEMKHEKMNHENTKN
jgi:hypothetical protein